MIQKIERYGDYNALFIDSHFYYKKETFDDRNFYNQLTLSIYFLSALDHNERDFKRKKRFEEFVKKANKDFEK